jgi:ABC-type oligopeptide transport system ATPase subunit
MSNLVKIKNLHISYKVGAKYFNAVKNVSFTIKPGEIVGLVGESGSGKTTIGRTLAGIMGLKSGHIYFDDQLVYGKQLNMAKVTKQIFNQMQIIKSSLYLAFQSFDKPKKLFAIINNINKKTFTLYDDVSAAFSYFEEY